MLKLSDSEYKISNIFKVSKENNGKYALTKGESHLGWKPQNPTTTEIPLLIQVKCQTYENQKFRNTFSVHL